MRKLFLILVLFMLTTGLAKAQWFTNTGPNNETEAANLYQQLRFGTLSTDSSIGFTTNVLPMTLDAATGSLMISETAEIYQKQDTGSSANWVHYGQEFEGARSFGKGGDAEYGFATDFLTGDDPIFASSTPAAVITGTFVKSSTALDLIDGHQVYKYTQASGSLNDFISSGLIDIPPPHRGQEVGLQGSYAYNGDNDDIQVSAICADDDLILPTAANNTSTTLVAATSTFGTGFFVPSTCTQVRVGFHVAVENSAKVLLFNKIKVTPNNAVKVTLQSENVFAGIVDNDGATATLSTQNSEFIASANRDSQGNVTVTWVADFFTVAPSFVCNPYEPSGGTISCAGYSITTTGASMRTHDTVGNPSDIDVSIHVVKQGADYDDPTSNYIAPTSSTLTPWVAFTPTGSWTTNSTYTGLWRRVGDEMEIQTEVIVSGNPNSVSLTFDIPTGYTIDTSKMIDTSVGMNVYHGLVTCQDGNAANDYFGRVGFNDTTSVGIFHESGSFNAPQATDQANPFTFANTDTCRAKYSVPIVEFQSDTKVLAAFPYAKKQRKFLSLDIIGDDSDITDLHFDNLIIGRQYKITFHLRFFTTLNHQMTVSAVNGGVNVLSTISSSAAETTSNSTATFTAGSSDIAVGFSEVSVASLEGDGSINKTWVELEEMPLSQDTTIY